MDPPNPSVVFVQGGRGRPLPGCSPRGSRGPTAPPAAAGWKKSEQDRAAAPGRPGWGGIADSRRAPSPISAFSVDVGPSRGRAVEERGRWRPWGLAPPTASPGLVSRRDKGSPGSPAHPEPPPGVPERPSGGESCGGEGERNETGPQRGGSGAGSREQSGESRGEAGGVGRPGLAWRPGAERRPGRRILRGAARWGESHGLVQSGSPGFGRGEFLAGCVVFDRPRRKQRIKPPSLRNLDFLFPEISSLGAKRRWDPGKRGVRN